MAATKTPNTNRFWDIQLTKPDGGKPVLRIFARSLEVAKADACRLTKLPESAITYTRSIPTLKEIRRTRGTDLCRASAMIRHLKSLETKPTEEAK